MFHYDTSVLIYKDLSWNDLLSARAVSKFCCRVVDELLHTRAKDPDKHELWTRFSKDPTVDDVALFDKEAFWYPHIIWLHRLSARVMTVQPLEKIFRILEEQQATPIKRLLPRSTWKDISTKHHITKNFAIKYLDVLDQEHLIYKFKFDEDLIEKHYERFHFEIKNTAAALLRNNKILGEEFVDKHSEDFLTVFMDSFSYNPHLRPPSEDFLNKYHAHFSPKHWVELSRFFIHLPNNFRLRHDKKLNPHSNQKRFY